MASYAFPLSFGARLLDPNRTRFRIWAPATGHMSLLLQDGSIRTMQRAADGIYSCEVDCGAGTRYQFVTDGGLTVPDPVSRCQADDPDGPSVVVDPNGYAWTNPDWKGRDWPEMVIYEVHTGCFGGSDGTFAGLEGRLGELSELGVTAVELMPIADFPGKRNWGYDGVLLYAPDRSYGTPDELKKFIDSAHGHGICVYLDAVYNHFGPDGNYLNAYAPDFFVADSDSPWGASIDFTNPRVRDFYTENALYWLMEYRFDGLRFDAVHAILEPDWLDEVAARIRRTVEPGRHVHLMLENEHNEAGLLRTGAAAQAGFDAQWNDDGHNVLHVLLTGEDEGYYRNYIDDPERKLARCLSDGFVYQGDPYPDHDDRPRGTSSAHLPPTAFVLFLQNHDQVGNRALGERLVSLTGIGKLRAAITVQLMCPQIPLLFMGEEWGIDTPFLFFTDFHGELAAAVRDGRRREFAGFRSFAEPELRSRIPDPNDPSTYRRSRLPELADPAVDNSGRPARNDFAHRQRRFYQRLLKLRMAEIVPRLSGCRSVGADVLAEGCVLARWRMGDDALLSIAINLSSRAAGSLDLPGRLLTVSDASARDAVLAGTLEAATGAVFLQT